MDAKDGEKGSAFTVVETIDTILDNTGWDGDEGLGIELGTRVSETARRYN